MSVKSPYFTLVVCEINELNQLRSYDSGANLRFPNIDDVHEVAKLAKLEHYLIRKHTDQSVFGDQVFATPLVRAIQLAANINHENEQAWKHALTKAINDYGKELSIESHKHQPRGVRIVCVRGEAKYDPRMSSRVRFGVACFIRPEKPSPWQIDVSLFVSTQKIGYRYELAQFIQVFEQRTGDVLTRNQAKALLVLAVETKNRFQAELLSLVPRPNTVEV